MMVMVTMDDYGTDGGNIEKRVSKAAPNMVQLMLMLLLMTLLDMPYEKMTKKKNFQG